MNDISTATERMSDPYWRINNLYSIVDQNGRKIPFKLNWAQDRLYHDMWYCNVVLKTRQLGILTFIGLLFLDRCLFNSNVSAGIIAHTREDAEIFFRRIKFAYDNLPEPLKEIRKANSDSARELSFDNGSCIRVGTSMRGQTLQYLHVSEMAKIAAKWPEKAREIITGSLNTLSPGQYVFIESTAEGRDGYFYELCKGAERARDSKRQLSQLDFRFHFYPWFEHPTYWIDPTGIIIPSEVQKYFRSIEAEIGKKLNQGQKAWYFKKMESQKEDMKSEFPSTSEGSWQSSSEGNYYSKYITAARQEKRITKVFYDPTQPVHTAWDLGYNDSTAIWLFQVDGQRINMLEYYENSGEPLPHYVQWLKSKSYSYGKHLVPHDASQHDYTTGLTRTEVAKNLGISFTQVPNVPVVDGIDAVRNILHRCYFNEEKCTAGLKMLDSYRKEWNDKHGCWRDIPHHNFASHGADAFRMLATGLSLLVSRGLTAEEWREVRERNLCSNL